MILYIYDIYIYIYIYDTQTHTHMTYMYIYMYMRNIYTGVIHFLSLYSILLFLFCDVFFLSSYVNILYMQYYIM